MGGLIHILLVLAVIAVLARIIMGRRIAREHDPALVGWPMATTTPAVFLRMFGSKYRLPVRLTALLSVRARNKQWHADRFSTGFAQLQVTLDSRQRPSWFCILSCDKTTTRVAGGTMLENGFGLPPVTDFGQVPAWLEVVARTLEADFDRGNDAAIDIGRRFTPIVPQLRAWLFEPGRKVAPASEPTLLEWAGQTPPTSSTIGSMRREAAWVGSQLAKLGTTNRTELAMIARRIAGDLHGCLLREALRVDHAAFRAALGREILAIGELGGWPLYRRVLGRALVDGADPGQVAAFHKLVTALAHLPGVLKKKGAFAGFPDVVDAARKVGRGWRAVATSSPEDLSVACFGVLVLLARDGSKTSRAAIDTVVDGQAAIDPDDYPHADCRDVAGRIRAAIR